MAVGKIKNINGENTYIEYATRLCSKVSNKTLQNCKNISFNILKNPLRLSIKWNDPNNEIDGMETVFWWGTKLIKNSEHIPIDENDGDLIEDIKIRNKYAIVGAEDLDIMQNETYYYALFPYTEFGVITNDEMNKFSCFVKDPVKWIKSYDGTYKFQKGTERWESTNYHVGSSNAETRWSIEVEEATSFSFDYGVSSEQNYDKLYVTLDSSTIVDGISGVINSSYSGSLSVGSHILKAQYMKDGTSDKNDDKAWIKFIDPIAE